MSLSHPHAPAPSAPEKYLIAFVIQGDDVFKITADNIIHTTGTANGPAFDAIAKLKAAAALLELTNRHKERPDELRQMARELAGEGMKLMARASAAIQAAAPDPTAAAVSGPAAAIEDLAVTTIPAEEAPAAIAAPPDAAPVAVIAASGPAPVPVPRPQERNAETGVVPIHSKIALISG